VRDRAPDLLGMAAHSQPLCSRRLPCAVAGNLILLSLILRCIFGPGTVAGVACAAEMSFLFLFET